MVILSIAGNPSPFSPVCAGGSSSYYVRDYTGNYPARFLSSVFRLHYIVYARKLQWFYNIDQIFSILRENNKFISSYCMIIYCFSTIRRNRSRSRCGGLAHRWTAAVDRGGQEKAGSGYFGRGGRPVNGGWQDGTVGQGRPFQPLLIGSPPERGAARQAPGHPQTDILRPTRPPSKRRPAASGRNRYDDRPSAPAGIWRGTHRRRRGNAEC